MRILSLVVFVATVFVSAFLLFQVQPMLARFVLPWFGGAPSVWTVCMLFFQVFLFLGYAYAHALRRWLPVQYQAMIHVGLLILAMTFLPITPDPHWRGLETLPPILVILLLLTTTVGIPYFLLSSTGPLLQVWFAMAHEDRSPYPLYAVSNAGSFLALLSYPFFIEPLLPVSDQVNVWSWFFILFAFLCIAIASYVAVFRKEARGVGDEREESVAQVGWDTKSLWVLLPAAASVILLSMTNHITQDIAAIPLLWVVPLSLYLLTFILCFESDRWYNGRKYGLALILAILSLAAYIGLAANQIPLIDIAIYCAFLFISCMICHGELVKLKPDANNLTSFYLSIAAGGALGGIFVGMIAPVLFESYVEVELCFVIFLALVLFANREDSGSLLSRGGRVRQAIVSGLGVLVLGIFVLDATSGRGSTSTVSRNFYGVLNSSDIELESGAWARRLVHGRIVHGLQYLSEDRQDEPTTYYNTHTAAGRLLQSQEAIVPASEEFATGRRVGVVGLGVGTLATYGRASDTFRFYEINPDVIRIAEKDFTFLSRSQSTVEVVLGDALISLEKEAPQEFDILVLDAFSGDAIPVHLLTLEAFKVYLRHLDEGGSIAIHISNNYFDLRPVLWALADELNLQGVVMDTQVESDSGISRARWMVLTRNDKTVDHLSRDPAFLPRDTELTPILWTDDYSNVLGVLKFKP